MSTTAAASCASPKSAPESPSVVATGATPISAAVSKPRSNVGDGNGSSASRCGSNVSSVPNPNSGTMSHAAVSAEHDDRRVARAGIVAHRRSEMKPRKAVDRHLWRQR